MNNPAPFSAPPSAPVPPGAAVAEDSEFVRFWNDVLAPKFIRFRHILVGGLSRHSDAVFPTLPVRSGDQVLDVGCGFGDTAIRLAGQARAEMKSRGVTNLSFVRGDAEYALPTNHYDFVFARFGTMFFANPVAGLRNMRQALRPGGRMVHIVWRERADNPWLSMAKDVVLKYLPAPGSDAQTCGPGPFSMADQAMVREMMKAAGYDRIEFRRVDAPVLVGKDVDDAIAFQLAIGPAGEVFREAGALAEAKRAEIEAALAAAIDAQKKASDGVVMDSSSWVISAINPP